jgi:hypothetical protein
MSRWMTLVLLAASICVVACEEQKPADPGVSGEKAAVVAVPIKDEDVATAADFDDEAEKAITADNYKAEVDTLEKEISAE